MPRPADTSGVTTPDRALAPLRLFRPETDGLPPVESGGRRRAVQGMALLALAASVAYLLWRVTSSLEGTALWLSVPLLLLEVHALAGLALFTHDLWDVDRRPVPDPGADDLVDVGALRVAVLVPTYDEPRAILLPTVAAAVATRRPHQTWVLDDGDRPWVREMAAELGARYRSRRNGAHAKAGNINEALAEVDADVVAVVDADHVISEGFLEALLPYFADPGVALVQSPQEFYNDSSFEHAARRGGRRFAEQELFYRGLLAGRNRWGAAFWCGTNAALRVAALESVGGVATDSVTEDIQTTLRLHRKGWRTVHHNEVLAYGLAAADPRAFFIQRSRWGAGAMQVLHRDNPLVGRGLSLHQRMSYVSTLFGWFDSWRTVGYVLLPVLTVITGAMPIAAPWREFLLAFVGAFVLQRIALTVLSRGRAPLLLATYFEFVRLPASLGATMHLFGSGPKQFRVTPKAPSSDRRRSAPPVLLAGLMGVTVVAGLYYLLTVAGLTWTTYDVPWVAHGAALWLAVNGAFVLAATGRIRRLEFAGNRRSAWRFGTDTEVELVDDRPGEQPRRARLVDVSIGGARLVVSGSQLATAGLAPGARTAVRLPVDGPEPLVVPATTTAVWPGEVQGTWNVGLHFDIGTAEAGGLALALYRTPVTADVPAPEPAGALVPSPRRPARVERSQLQQG